EPLLPVSRVQGEEGVDDPPSIERCEGVEGDVGLIKKLRVPASKSILPVPDVGQLVIGVNSLVLLAHDGLVVDAESQRAGAGFSARSILHESTEPAVGVFQSIRLRSGHAAEPYDVAAVVE